MDFQSICRWGNRSTTTYLCCQWTGIPWDIGRRALHSSECGSHQHTQHQLFCKELNSRNATCYEWYFFQYHEWWVGSCWLRFRVRSTSQHCYEQQHIGLPAEQLFSKLSPAMDNGTTFAFPMFQEYLLAFQDIVIVTYVVFFHSECGSHQHRQHYACCQTTPIPITASCPNCW